jgi:3-keto-5-aminohexanoate cleavage enzyme
MEPLIIEAAITGTAANGERTIHLPVTPDQIVADAQRCRDAGASIIHVQAHDDTGRPTYRRDVYRQIFTRLRELDRDLIILGSTSGRLGEGFLGRSEVLAPGSGCRPDMASLPMGSYNVPNRAIVNTPDMIRALADAMHRGGIVPAWECLDMGMIDAAHWLISKGILIRPYYCTLVLGSLGTLGATAYHLAATVRALPEETIWSAAGIGRFQFFINSMAVTMGGHVRVGLADSLYFDTSKTQPATNPGMVDRIVKLARAAGRRIATPREARRRIGLAPAVIDVKPLRKAA